MQIRSAGAGEGLALVALNREVHALHVIERPDIFRADVEAAKLAETFEVWIADETHLVRFAVDGSPVGFLVGEWTDRPAHTLVHGSSVLVIDQIGVAAGHRRLGIGSALLRDALALAEERPVDRFELTVREFNTRARQFFRSLGFNAVTERMSRDLR